MTDSPSYEIKPVSRVAIEQAENIWSLAFGKYWPRDYEFRALDMILGAFDGDQLHAIVAVVDFQMNFANQHVPCAGISAVATVPGQRHQNLITKLLKNCLRNLHDRGVPLAALYPFSYPFYEHMGWAATHRQYAITTDTADLKLIAQKGKARNFRLLAADDCEKIAPVHERWSQLWNMSLNRSAARCKHLAHIPTQKWQYFLHDDAYMMWDMQRSEGKKLVVSEFAYTTEQAYLDGLALLGQMGAQFDEVQWLDAEYQPFLKLGVPPKPRIELQLGMMSRIVNLEAFAALLPESIAGLNVFDPLGVSAPESGEIGVGHLVQHLTGFFDKPDSAMPENLHGIVGQKPAFCFDRF